MVLSLLELLQGTDIYFCFLHSIYRGGVENLSYKNDTEITGLKYSNVRFQLKIYTVRPTKQCEGATIRLHKWNIHNNNKQHYEDVSKISISTLVMYTQKMETKNHSWRSSCNLAEIHGAAIERLLRGGGSDGGGSDSAGGVSIACSASSSGGQNEVRISGQEGGGDAGKNNHHHVR